MRPGALGSAAVAGEDMTGKHLGRRVPHQLAQIALVTLGVTLLIASLIAFGEMMAAGGMELSVTESMAGAAATNARFSVHTLLAMVLPLGAIGSFVAYGIARHQSRGINARRSVG